MLVKRRRRLFTIIALLACIGLAFALSLYALRQNISLYFTPSQIAAGLALKEHNMRVGGLVTFVQHKAHSLEVNFTISDMQHQLKVYYNGVLPDLFRIGTGVVVQGRLQPDGSFMAHQVLAKHDENYMPPKINTTSRQGPI